MRSKRTLDWFTQKRLVLGKGDSHFTANPDFGNFLKSRNPDVCLMPSLL